MADRQMRRVYKWENTWGVWSDLDTKDTCRTWLDWACCEYGIEVPELQFSATNHGASYYLEDAHLIRLKPKHNNFSVVLHEAAHAIATIYYPATVEDHGPEWLGIYLWLLKASGSVPESALKASAKEHGLKWRAIAKSSPAAVKRQAKRKGPLRGLNAVVPGVAL